MRLVFGKATEDTIEACGEEGFFKGCNGNLYNFQIEVNEEEEGEGFIRITDGIGRMIPVDFRDLQGMTSVLRTLESYLQDKANFKAHWNERFSRG